MNAICRRITALLLFICIAAGISACSAQKQPPQSRTLDDQLVSEALVQRSWLIGAVILAGIVLVFILIVLHINRSKRKELTRLIAEADAANIRKNTAIYALESILNSIEALIYATDPDTGEIIFVNDYMRKVYNKTDDELIGEPCYKIFRGLDEICDNCPRDRLSKEPDSIVIWDAYTDVLERHLRHSDRFIDWPNGKKVYLHYAIDITEYMELLDKLNEANERTKLMLNAVPLACSLRDKDFNVIDCNAEAIKLFKLKDKDEYQRLFYELSPEYQPDGRRSSEMADIFRQQAYETGRFSFEWMHRDAEGTPIPTEVTLVRVETESDYSLIGYTRDLREHKQMMEIIEKRDFLLHTVNETAAILLQSDGASFTDDLLHCMSMIGKAVSADRVCIWKNHINDGRLSCTKVYEWLSDPNSHVSHESAITVSYDEDIPNWVKTLSQGESFNMLISDMDPEARKNLSAQGVLSVFVVPVFVQDKFWGHAGFDNCHDDRLYTELERSILRSGALLFTNALIRHELNIDIRNAAKQLETVLENHPGIIWCVDSDGIVTLYNGMALKRIGVSPDDVVGQNINDLPMTLMPRKVVRNISGTLAEGEQEWISKVLSKTYHIRTSPIYGDVGDTVGVVGSIDEITELIRLQDELKEALDKASEANKAKSNFLAQMSHEIRTPMNAILGISEIQLRDERLSAEAEEGFKEIYESGTLLLNIINDILDFSKIESGKMEIIPEKYNIPSLINDTVQLCRLRYDSKPIDFILQLNENTPLELIGDELRIRQILNNLLSNAFKYTQEGKVKLSVNIGQENAGEDVSLILRVSDTGQGMRKDQLDRLFGEYERFNMEANRSIPGTGLGMHITKRLVDMMNGEILVESRPGIGSAFTVRLPQRSCGSAVCGAELAEKLRFGSFNDTKITKNAHIVHEYMPYGKVLVVDDVRSNLQVAKGMLLPYGLQIETAVSGTEAIEKIKDAGGYDVVFMDHMMPNMDGIQATRVLRDMGYTRPIVALTANAIVGQAELFLSNGFDGFISKPIDSRELDLLLRDLIRDKDASNSFDPAKREQHETEADIPAVPLKKTLSEVEEYFVMDADDTILALKSLYAKIDVFTDADIESYLIVTHGIKSALLNIGETKLSEFALSLEQAGEERNIDKISDKTPAFIDELQSLTDKLRLHQ